MSTNLRTVGRTILEYLAKLTIKKHNPKVIGIVGNGSTSIVRETLFTAINQTYPARRNLEIPDVEFSLPLTVIGAQEYPKSLFEWIKLAVVTFWQTFTIKPYFHFLILEMSPSNKETLEYYLRITKPALIVICGKEPERIDLTDYKTVRVESENIEQIKKDVLTIFTDLSLNAEQTVKAISKTSFYPSRIRFFPAINGTLIIDATHYYYPTSLKSVTELLEELPGNKAIITDEKIDLNRKDFTIISPSEGIDTANYSAIVVRGKRSERFELLDKLTGGNYE